MSYALSAPLQAAIYQHLRVDAQVQALVGAHVYDALPPGPVPALYVALGPEKVRDASDTTGGGAWHDVTLSVVSDSAGFQSAKTVAGAVSDAIESAALSLSRGRVVVLRFLRAEASRESAGVRRIDLIFRARVDDS